MFDLCSISSANFTAHNVLTVTRTEMSRLYPVLIKLVSIAKISYEPLRTQYNEEKCELTFSAEVATIANNYLFLFERALESLETAKISGVKVAFVTIEGRHKVYVTDFKGQRYNVLDTRVSPI